jgi:bifunctional UDP-N-acetylglucosamine pyrophosphorylase / glucosamine-1-phosphate N-acetyltransferase
MPLVAAPTVVILAAGQGTRMRSSTPKVLHELCGRPMVLWPVRAALAAGAARVVVVDSPQRALEQILPEGIELTVQPAPNGTGGALVAAVSQLDLSSLAPPHTVVVLSGDVPLVDAHAIRALTDAHEQGNAAATMLTTVLEDPSGYGRVVRDAAGGLVRVVETKADGDSTLEERLITEVNTGIYAFDAQALSAALPRLSADNAQGELYLPQVLDLLAADGRTVMAHRSDDPTLVLGVNDRVALASVRKLE